MADLGWLTHASVFDWELANLREPHTHVCSCLALQQGDEGEWTMCLSSSTRLAQACSQTGLEFQACEQKHVRPSRGEEVDSLSLWKELQSHNATGVDTERCEQVKPK